jgi:hypothetical protein
MRKSNLVLLWLTPIFILLANLTAFIHEYAHSFTAWALGFKDNPFNIIYGGWSWQNIFFLANIDENVNYAVIDQLGYQHFISLIAFAGPGIGTLLVYLISLYLLRKKFNSYLYYLIFWINLAQIRELWAYVPLRALSTSADIANINHSLSISPYWIFMLVTPLVALGVWNFFVNTLKNSYTKLDLYDSSSQATLLILTVIFFFGFTSLQILTANYNFITRNLTWSSLILIPLILFFCWPKKELQPVSDE